MNNINLGQGGFWNREKKQKNHIHAELGHGHNLSFQVAASVPIDEQQKEIIFLLERTIDFVRNKAHDFCQDVYHLSSEDVSCAKLNITLYLKTSIFLFDPIGII